MAKQKKLIAETECGPLSMPGQSYQRMVCQIWIGPTKRWHIEAWHEYGSNQGSYEYHGSDYEARASSYDLDEAARDVSMDLQSWDCGNIHSSTRKACLHNAHEEALEYNDGV